MHFFIDPVSRSHAQGYGGQAGWKITYTPTGKSTSVYCTFSDLGYLINVEEEEAWSGIESTTAPFITVRDLTDVPSGQNGGRLSGNVKVKVQWVGDPTNRPAEAYIDLHAVTYAVFEVRQGSGTASTSMSIKDAVEDESHTPVSGYSSKTGHKLIRIPNTAATTEIDITLSASGVGDGLASVGSASASVSASMTNKALQFQTPSVTYGRIATQSSDGSWLIQAYPNQLDRYGDMHGDYGVDYRPGDQAWGYEIGYEGELLGEWSIEDYVDNQITTTNYASTYADTGLREVHGIVMSEYVRPLALGYWTYHVINNYGLFNAGNTIEQKVTWTAFDHSDGICAKTTYYMTLQPVLQKEEEYKPGSVGDLWQVSKGYYPKKAVDHDNTTDHDGSFLVEIKESWDVNEKTEHNASVSGDIEDILRLSFGATTIISSGHSFSIGKSWSQPISKGKRFLYYLIPEGSCRYYNMSQ